MAGSFLEALAANHFDRLATVLDDHASLAALLPRGFRVCHGVAENLSGLEQWFRDVEEFEVADASVGQVGPRLQLRGPRVGDKALIVEQHIYADSDPSYRSRSVSLLCSGFGKGHLDG
jgi:hypothetical protein